MLRNSDLSIETLASHAGRADLAELGVHAPPLDLSSTYPLPDLDLAVASLDELAAGGASAPSPVYARLANPTVSRFESALAELEGAASAVAFSSGMAALTAALLAATDAAAGSRGRHVVAVRPLYGGSDHLLASGLLGVETTFVAPAEVAGVIRPDTALVILETPANPTLALVDIAALVEAVAPVPVLVDSTFATPVLQRPLAHGATFALHSATKFLGGHGDVVGGVIATTDEWARRLRVVRIVTGAILHPLAAYLLQRGLPTLPLRVRAAEKTATELARRLGGHPAVVAVHHPSLPECDPDRLVGTQMAGPGSIVAFEVVGGYAGARALLGSLALITHAVSLGSTDSLIQHPAGLTHRLVDPCAQRQCGITQGMLRLSVGLEGVEDLWRELETGLAAVHASVQETSAATVADEAEDRVEAGRV